MVGDNDRQPRIFGDADPLTFGDAGVAGQQHVRLETRIFQQLAQLPGLYTVAFAEAVGHMKADTLRRPQLLQRRHQQSRTGLAVHIEIPPDQEILALADCIEQRMGSPLQPDQCARRRRRIGSAIEKRQRPLRRVDLPLRQQLRHKRMPTHRSAQRFRRFDLWQQDPGLGGHYRLGTG